MNFLKIAENFSLQSKQRKLLRKLGFFLDSEGILNRYYREKGAWDSHLENTKKAILQSAESKGKNIAVVLGSGWLLDVPLAELAEMFGKVYLVILFIQSKLNIRYQNLKT